MPGHPRLLVEAESAVADDGKVHVLLHVRAGFLWMLEVYRDDGEAFRTLPDPSALEMMYTPAGLG